MSRNSVRILVMKVSWFPKFFWGPRQASSIDCHFAYIIYWFKGNWNVLQLKIRHKWSRELSKPWPSCDIVRWRKYVSLSLVELILWFIFTRPSKNHQYSRPHFTMPRSVLIEIYAINNHVLEKQTQIARFMGPTWGPLGSCRPQLGPMLAPWALLSGKLPWLVKSKTDPSQKQNRILVIQLNCFFHMPVISHVPCMEVWEMRSLTLKIRNREWN